jgi:gluconolactonase
MLESIVCFLLLLLQAPTPTSAPSPELAPLLAQDAKLTKVAGDFKFVEGPCWSETDGGYLVFSDIPADEMKRWDAAHGISTYRKPSHQANGNTRTPDGNLVTCEHETRRVEIERDGKVQVLVDNFQGKKFNSPNDVIVESDGTIWFTDPPYGVPKGQQREIEKQNVYRVKDGVATIAVDDFDMPNGLCFSPDESKLYIADSGSPHHIRVFDVQNGELKNSRTFAVLDNGIPDGIRCDEKGNIWSSAGDGIHVFTPDGQLIGKIPVPETPANLCFGGADGKTLFITARTSLYSIETNVTGATRRAPK